MASKAVIKLEGFEELLKEIDKAGGSIDAAVERAVQKSADIVEEQLRAACPNADIASEIEQTRPVMQHNVCKGAVGWKMGNYDPKNPSAGYKAVFLNYGTARRYTKAGADRGAIEARGFISTAKKKSKKLVKNVQEETLREILGGIKE